MGRDVGNLSKFIPRILRLHFWQKSKVIALEREKTEIHHCRGKVSSVKKISIALHCFHCLGEREVHCLTGKRLL